MFQSKMVVLAYSREHRIAFRVHFLLATQCPRVSSGEVCLGTSYLCYLWHRSDLEDSDLCGGATRSGCVHAECLAEKGEPSTGTARIYPLSSPAFPNKAIPLGRWKSHSFP